MIKIMKPMLRTMDTRTTRPPAKQADPELRTQQHKHWREVVLRRAGYRCEAIENGERCKVSAPERLFADHIIERRDGGDPLDVSNGQCLCGRHHTLKTVTARVARMSERY